MLKQLRPVIQVVEEKCVNCHRCIMACPVKMCNNGSGNAVNFNPKLCIGCGECVHVCAHNARIGIDDFGQFMQDLKSGTSIIAVTAPAIAATFAGEYLRFNGYLKTLGVKAVFDVSFGAELTVKSYVAYRKKKNPPLVIAQPCPSLVTFIEIYRPELIPYLAPVDSPMGHTMKMIKRFYPQYEGHKIAAISPCYAKRREFDETGLGDYNVTFKSIQESLEAGNLRLSDYPETPYDGPAAERGVLFSSPGGLLRTLERYDRDASSHTKKTEGNPEVYRYLAHLEKVIKQHGRPAYALVDCLSCKMGCNGGPGTLNQDKHPDEMENNIERRGKESRSLYGKRGQHFSKSGLEKLLNDYWEEGLYSRAYTDRSELFKQSVVVPSQNAIQEVHRKMYKTSPRDILDCASCGYATCEQMVVAIINGLNKPENCRHFIDIQKIINEEQKKKLNEILRTVYERTVEEMSKSIEGVGTLSNNINETADAVLRSSAGIEEMVKSVQGIHTALERNAQTVERLTASSQEGKNRIAQIRELIAGVSGKSEELINTCQVIGVIAAESGILGMNAAIEAAHAGEAAGKGFAVVAEQIRKLADNSGREAGEIKRSLKEVKQLIGESCASSVQAQTQFDRIVELAETVKAEERRIEDAAETQNQESRRILENLHEITALILKIKNESSVLADSGRTVLENLGSLKGAASTQEETEPA
ncbi:MAG: methyl-accepting chemotaxis protein [Treponema sp.]|jgi:iron only hydrogenase large subunit-like protein|nr:methyl-accepting chemotaxis protein [Treponema sp.]